MKTLCGLLVAAVAGQALGDCSAKFTFPDFSTTTDLTFVGTALASSDRIYLTSEGEGGAGAAWYTTSTAALTSGFTTSFRFLIENGQADGFAFVVQSYAPDALGGGGSDLGYAGIERSLAVEIDTFRFEDEFQVAHISVQSRGSAANDFQDSASLAHVVLPDNLEGEHTVKIEYTPGVMYVWLDENPVLFVPVNLDNIDESSVLDGGCAWVGFTAGAGAATADQTILSWDFNDFSQDECDPVQLGTGWYTSNPETGDRVELEWTVTGPGPIFYQWYQHEDIPLSDNERRLGSQTTKLIIDPWTPADAFAYDFGASNDCGGFRVSSFTPGIRCPGDLNYDGLVDDSDFIEFVPAYNNLVVPEADRRCDWNGDRFVDDADFLFFVGYYNNLLCE
ncbi:MAG: hypothetical protein U0570_04685 [Phycisphaerales bacterium]